MALSVVAISPVEAGCRVGRQRDSRTLQRSESRRPGAAAGSEGREGDMARGRTIHFLLTYDRSERRLVNIERFRDGRKAVDAYDEREREFADRPHIEVVLLGADSEDAIRVTHPIYFETDFSLEKYANLLWLTPEPAAD